MIVNVLTDGGVVVEVFQDNLPNVVEVFESATPNVVEIVTAGPQGPVGPIGPVGPYPETGSFATTGSNIFRGNQLISGSLTVTQGVSSSFSGSGANLFNIPASAIVGLNLSQIVSGSVSASISPNSGLEVNTNVTATSFTGSLQGTASNSTSASYALTSSYSNNSTSASYALSSTSASYAATASNILGGRAPHIPFFITDTTLATSSIYQSGSTSVIINQDDNTTANPEALYVWQPHPTSINVISGKGNVDNYLQLNIQNTNQGTAASSDVVATADNGNETSNYIDMGINSENYNSGFIGDANDAYLYSTGLHLHIGNASDEPIMIFAGGTDVDVHNKLILNPNNQHEMTGSLEISQDLTVLGGITGSLYGTASYAQTASHAPLYLPLTGGTINGNVTVNGTASIAFLNVQYESASVIYSSGSNVFGDATNDIQTLVGTVLVSGSQQITGSLNVSQGITGSLFGTASYVTGSIFTGANPALTSSNALTASYVNPLVQSVIITGSLITTGSNKLIGDTSLTGSLNITGSTTQIGNNTLLGNTVLSGSIGISGSSTIQGTTSMTGSLLITGSTTQVGNNTLLGNTLLSGSITISGSVTPGNLSASVNIFGDTAMTGFLRFNPYSTNIDTSISASYIFVSGSTNDLYFSQNGDGYANTTRLRWLEGNLYTGLLNGGVLSVSSPTVYNVSSGSGIIVELNGSYNDNPYPTVQYLNWGNLSANISPLSASADWSFIAINSAAAIEVKGTPYEDGEYNTKIPLGLVLHQNRSTINGVQTFPSLAYGWKQRSFDFMKAFGPLKISGYTLSPSGSSTGSLALAGGISWVDGRNYTIDPNNPSYITEAVGIATSKIFRYHQSGSGWIYDTNGGAGYTSIDPSKYSLNGVLTPVPTNDFTIQRVYYFPNSATKALFVYYGNDHYSNIDLAKAAIGVESFAEAPNTAANALFIGYMFVRHNADFTVAASYDIQSAGLFRGSGGSGGSSGGGGTTTPGGSTTQIQYNNAGAFGGVPNLTWDGTTLRATGSFTGSISNAVSASYASTASYALNGGSGGTPFPYTGSAQITGSLTVVGPLQVTGPVVITGSLSQGAAGNKALGVGSHAEGQATHALGNYSHAEGYVTSASGNWSHAEGYGTVALFERSHAEGYLTLTSGIGSHAEGYKTTASGYFSHAEGGWNDFDGTDIPGSQAIGGGSHAEGFRTIAYGNGSHAEGDSTLALGTSSHTEGYFTTASGDYSHAEGIGTRATGEASHAEGVGFIVDPNIFVEIGNPNGYILTDYFSGTPEAGSNTTTLILAGDQSGGGTPPYTLNYLYIGSDTYSFEVNNKYYTTIPVVTSAVYNVGTDLTTFTFNPPLQSSYSFVYGTGLIASGLYSHAEGDGTKAQGTASHAEGYNTVALGNYQHVQGTYNISSSAQGAFIHGNGTSDANRSNLIFTSGSIVQITGSLRVSGSITGSLLGTATTASYVTGSIFTSANPALSSSRAVTSSYALTASYVIGGGGGGSAITVTDEGGSPLTTALASLDFVGSGVTATAVGNAVTVSIAGGGGSTFPYTGNAQITGSLSITSTLQLDGSLTDFATVNSTIVGANNLYTQTTGSYTSVFIKYTVSNGANSRAGEFITNWNGTTVTYFDNSTTDIGSTSDIVFSSAIVSSQIQVNATAASSGWKIKTLATFI